MHTRIEGALCVLRAAGDGFCAYGRVDVDMRLRCASGLEVETARIGAMAFSGNGPDKLILKASRVEYHSEVVPESRAVAGEEKCYDDFEGRPRS